MASAGIIHAQWRKPRLSHLGPLQGMTSWTFDITQDSTGYMYFGTDQGLVRYDGSQFELFAHNPNDSNSIGPGDVQCVLASPGGLVWIGTRLSGFYSFDPRHRRFRHYPYPGLMSSGYATVHCIYEEDGFLWLGGDTYFLHRFDKTTGQFESFLPAWITAEMEKDRFSLTEILQDRLDPDLLWMALVNHNPKYAGKQANWLVSFHKEKKTFEKHECWGIPRHQDSDGRIWLTTQGINRFDPVSGYCEHFPVIFNINKHGEEAWVSDMVFNSGSYLLSAPYAIARFKPNGDYEEVEYGKELGIVGDIYIDAQKNIWFGHTDGITILRAQEESIRYFDLSNFGFSGRIYPGRLAYQADSNKIFVIDHAFDGTGRKIISMDLDSGNSSLFYQSDSPVHGIAMDDAGNLWMSSNGGFYKLDTRESLTRIPKQEKLSHSPVPWLWNLSLSPQGWIAGTGIHQFWWFKPGEPARVLSLDQLDSAGQGKSVSLLQGLSFTRQDEALLFSNQIYAVELRSGKITQLLFEDRVNPFPATDIHSVMEDSRGHIWVSNLAMTAEFRRSGDSLILLKKYTTADGLGCAWVHELYPDRRGRIWAFAQNGLNVIDPVLQEVRQFGVREGLVNPYIDPRQVLTLKDGRLLTVNGTGIIVFHPDSLWNAYTPKQVPVVIKEIRISGKPVSGEQDVNNLEGLVLKPDQDFVDVLFQGLAYPTDYNLSYSYKVEGLHDNWISIGANKLVTLSSLEPGDYLLKIKAGEPSNPAPEKTLAIHMRTPMFLQTWFLLLLGLGLLGLMMGVYRWRIRNIRAQESEKLNIRKQMGELELKALRAQMNPHFMFNSLNSIKNYIFKADPKQAAEYLSNFAHLIRRILQNSKERTISLQNELETLVLYIELEQMRFENKFEFNCIVEEGLDLDAVFIPPMLLQPFVENAIWHGLMHKKEKGHLLLQFSKNNEATKIVVEDDGVGRDKAVEMKNKSAGKYKSMGIGITRDRIEIMNKMDALDISVDIVDKRDPFSKPSGTRVILNIPRNPLSLINPE